MNHHYKDIRDLTDKEPEWWDENGVPRYCEFYPSRITDIYKKECALCLIACQGCGRRFRVALSESLTMERLSISNLIDKRQLHYGDPPNMECCPSGPTINSIMIRVVEYWAVPKDGLDLVRDKTREVRFSKEDNDGL